MSGKETADGTLDDNALAFEYVAGSLQGSERDSFQQRMHRDSSLADRVLFWENHLAALQDEDAELAQRIDSFRDEQTDTVLANPDPREA